jgi:hypothetical protein
VSAAAKSRLVQWFIFGVIASLVPLLADALVRHADHRSAGWPEVIGHGELLLVTGAIAFPAFGAILMSDVGGLVRGIFGGFAVVTLFLIALLYASVARVSTQADPHFIVGASLILFVIMLVIGGVCVGVAKTEGER